MTTCTSCTTELPDNAKFCLECGASISSSHSPAEYKQVTVLFADVVRSMDIAAAVGTERLREIMAELLDRSTAVVRRYGGTVNQFTGDGIMAVFGAPIALEDHAFRACLAALDIQKDIGATIQLRIGLNSGQVIAGEIGSSAGSYTTIGEQVGMAQRMESVAPPGGVMLSEATARLLPNTVLVGEPELVRIKGSQTPVSARLLLSIAENQTSRRGESTLVGRSWEINTVTGILDEAISGDGCVVTIVGAPGIGKSRLVREAAAIAAQRGVPVVTTYCESHASEIPFHVVAHMLRAAMGIEDLDAASARARVRDSLPETDHDDLLLLDDLLGIRDSSTALPDIAPEARRRRLTALIIGATLASEDPAAYVIEDAQWIDGVSESMLADFLAVVPQSHVLTLITYRPEYRGALAKVAGSQSITLRPLSRAHVTTLTAELLGSHPSIDGLADRVVDRAAGNPFFAEEIVRDLAERGVLRGARGSYALSREVADVDVPATLQATIGARIDRLDPVAKTTLNAAAVIGSRFEMDVLASVVDKPDVAALIDTELVNQVKFTANAEYRFRHPLIRTVAYESQLKSDRAYLHRNLARAIEAREPRSADENAALIAEHLEAAGDNHAAYDWHMRAAAWLNIRDIAAAQASWARAQQVADLLPEDDPERMAMRIAPRALLCALAYRVGGSSAPVEFDELRDLCAAAGDRHSLAIGMTGRVMTAILNARRREASLLANEYIDLLDALGDESLTIGLLSTPISAKYEAGEMREVLRLAQRVLDLAGGDLTKGVLLSGSPLGLMFAYKSIAQACLGLAGWQDDFRHAVETALAVVGDPNFLSGTMVYTYVTAVSLGFLLPDSAAVHNTAEAVARSEQSGDDFALKSAQTAWAVILAHREGEDRETGLRLLREIRTASLNQQFSLTALPTADIEIAREQLRSGDLDGAISLSRTVANELLTSGGCIWTAPATTVLVEALLCRGHTADLAEAQAVADRLAAVPTDGGFVINETFLLRLRALLAQACGDYTTYREYRDRYGKMATDLGFEGHMAWAAAMS
jgi:adenylate cyclase